MKPLALTSTVLAALLWCSLGGAQQLARPADIPIEKFAQLPRMRQAALSPDGSHLAYITPINGRGHLVIQKLVPDGSRPYVVTPGKTMDFSWLHWANDDRLIYVVSAMSRRANVETQETRLLAVNEDGSNPISIVKPATGKRIGSRMPSPLAPPQIQDDIIHWLPDEPHFILVSLDADHDSANEIRRIDIRDGKYTIAQHDFANIQTWLTDLSGVTRIGWGYDRFNFKLMTRQKEDRWRIDTKAAWRDAGFFPVGFTDDPDVAYAIGPNEKGYEVLRRLNIKTGELLDTILARDGFDIGDLLLDPLTQLPVGAHLTEHQTEFHYFDEGMAGLQRALDEVLPDTVNSIVSTSRDRRKALVHSSSDVDAGVYRYLDRDKGTLDFVAEAMPGIAPALMSPVEPVSYQARDGLRIPAYLTVPLGMPREKLKIVVLPHGGPAARDSKSFWFLSQFIASRGYAVFQPNFRGSTGYGRDFEFAGRREWGGKMQEDVADGARWLIEEGIADPEKICIVGWSYGGYAAAMGAVQTPDLYQCAASINGVLNLPRLIADDKKYVGGSEWTKHVGLGDESSAKVSPYHQAEHIHIPMLIIQAKDDSRVHLDQGKRMAKRLKRQKKRAVYVEVELGGHSMTNEIARQQILRALETFLAENLQ